MNMNLPNSGYSRLTSDVGSHETSQTSWLPVIPDSAKTQLIFQTLCLPIVVPELAGVYCWILQPRLNEISFESIECIVGFMILPRRPQEEARENVTYTRQSDIRMSHSSQPSDSECRCFGPVRFGLRHLGSDFSAPDI